MAVEMMHFSAMDKQFLDDNMLTDEDFKFGGCDTTGIK